MTIGNSQWTELDTTVAPQLVRNAPLLTLFLKLDPGAAGPMLPSGVRLHPNARLVLNRWEQGDPNETTGFGEWGAMSVSYFAVETAGPTGCTADGALQFPGRAWLHHWCSSPAARNYALQASGLHIDAGATRLQVTAGDVAVRLHVGTRECVRASARISSNVTSTRSGHSLYYASRSRGGIKETAVFSVPWIADELDVEAAQVAIDFPQSHPIFALLGDAAPTVVAASFRRIAEDIAAGLATRDPKAALG